MTSSMQAFYAIKLPCCVRHYVIKIDIKTNRKTDSIQLGLDVVYYWSSCKHQCQCNDTEERIFFGEIFCTYEQKSREKKGYFFGYIVLQWCKG
jgi:hypothetical protein